MTNLRNRQLRPKDIRALLSIKERNVTWDQGFEEGNEWVLASAQNDKYKKRLLIWLESKKVDRECEVLLLDGYCNIKQIFTWGKFIENASGYFEGHYFKVVDLDATWVLEYTDIGSSRFGFYA
jgi:hypothetical protein